MRIGRMQVGVALTLAYGLGLAVLVYCRWTDVVALELNELGDFAAGAAGPIAFLWLVLGYFQQGDELAMNTQAIRDQAEELALSVAAQEELAQATKQQYEFAERQATEQAMRAKYLAQPKLQLEIGDVRGIEGSDAFFPIYVSNYGSGCSNLTVTLSSGGVRLKIEQIGRFDTHATHPIDVVLPESLIDERISATYNYNDAEGEMQHQTCDIEIVWLADTESYVVHSYSFPHWEAPK